MEKYLSFLKHTTLFEGLQEAQIQSMANCLQASRRSYRKGEYVLRQGAQVHAIAILAQGLLHVQKDDYWGNHSLLHQIAPGELFAEAYAMAENEVILNDVVAVEDSTVLFFQAQKVLTVCSNACPFHSLIIQNLFRAISAKNRHLTQKIDYMAQRTIRDKLLAYLSAQSELAQAPTFQIPFNRQQLADFLSVERSAMCRELGKMRDEGLLSFARNTFVLLSPQRANPTAQADH